MTESQVGFLYKIAAAVSKSGCDDSNTLLKSYYLMRCKDITRGYGLPDKHFSPKVRCPRCCMEWKNNSEIKVRSIKLSKRQKQRLKSRKITKNRKQYARRLLISNELERICLFCKNSTVNSVLKPQKQSNNNITSRVNDEPKATRKENTEANDSKAVLKNKKQKFKAQANVYSNAMDIFSMQNKNNILASTIKEKPKVINNNKRKKDKFAGLCQKAVLTSAKLKQEKKESKGLSLFLKPSK